MNQTDQVRNRIVVALGHIQYLIRLLYAVGNGQARYLLLNDLWNQVAYLQSLFGLLEPALPTASPPTALPMPSSPPSAPAQGELPTITRQELATYTGRNGRPAYVAVNGTVYDVTNAATWSLGTHFGLPAGRDLSAEFASCHAGQQWILSTLEPVGRLT